MLIINTNQTQLDFNFIYTFLHNSYWGNNRTKAEVQKSIDNSLCFGMYLNKKQIGFARVLTDKVVFSYLMDVLLIKNIKVINTEKNY